MNIEKHIRHLLFEQNCVIIPDFGGFIANYVSAAIHPIRHTFLPPSKNIAFNELLKVNDGLLISQVSTQEQVSREDAAQGIKSFLETIKNEIKFNKKYRFEDIGTLYMNHEQKLQFEPENTINFLNSSFGLSDLQFKPIERNNASRVTGHDHRNSPNADGFATRDRDRISPVENKVAQNANGKRQMAKWQTAVIPVLLFLSVAFGYFAFLDRGNNALSSLNPFALLDDNFFVKRKDSVYYSQQKKADNASIIPTNTDQKETNEWNKNIQKPTNNEKQNSIKKEEKSPVAETKKIEAKKEAVKKIEVKKPAVTMVKETSKIRYYIIIGGFGSISNAERLKTQLFAKGYTSAKVLPAGNNGLIKVSYGDYATESEANQQTGILKAQYPGAWIYKN